MPEGPELRIMSDFINQNSNEKNLQKFITLKKEIILSMQT